MEKEENDRKKSIEKESKKRKNAAEKEQKKRDKRRNKGVHTADVNKDVQSATSATDATSTASYSCGKDLCTKCILNVLVSK